MTRPRQTARRRTATTRSTRTRGKSTAKSAPKAKGKTRSRRAPPRRKLPVPGPRASALVLCALALLAVLLLVLPSLPFIGPRPTSLWEGYQTVLVRLGGRADAALPAALAKLGPGVVSERTTSVDFYDFMGSSRVTLADLGRRLDPQDPRRDPYVRRVAGYFTVTSSEADSHVAYVPSRSGSLILFLRLRQLLGSPAASGWRLVDFDPVEKLVAVGAALGFALVMSFASHRRRRGTLLLSLLGAILWTPSLLNGGAPTFALCLIMMAAWLPLAHEWLLFVRGEGAGRSAVESRLAFFGGVAVASGALFLALGGWSASRFALALSPSLSSLVLLSCVPFFCAVADRWRGKRARSPIPYVRSETDPQRGSSLALTLALFSVALVGLLPLARGGACPAPIPVIGARDFTWQSLAKLHARGSADRLPDLADYVSHEAYQQTLGLGRAWAFPVRDERVYQRDYLVDRSTGVIQARLETVKVFGSPWLASVVARPVPGTVEALLIAQNRPVAAAVQGPAGPLSRSLPFTIVVFCALLALLGRDLGLGPLIRGNLWRLNSEARRDQVP